MTTAVGSGSYVDPRGARITVDEWSKRWLQTKTNLKRTTRATYETLARTHVLPAWGSRSLSAVTHEGVARWVGDLEHRGLSGSTVRQTHRVFSLMLDLAVKDGRLARNPAAGVPLPRPAQTRLQLLDHAEVGALASAAGEHSTTLLFLAYTGLRFGELAALRVGRLDLDRRRARIVEAVVEVRGEAVFGSPKNHQARTVPVPRFLVPELADRIRGRDPGDFVFSAPHGGVLRLSNFRRTVFEPAARAIGRPDVTPHTLRHTAASLAIAAGANVKVIQTMLGHKSATMTLDLYGHLFADQLDEVSDAMELSRSRSLGIEM